MANKGVIQAIVNRIIDHLKSGASGFGDLKIRPQSYYKHLGHDHFSDILWKKAEELGVLPPEVDWIEEEFNIPSIPVNQRPLQVATALFERHPELQKRLEALANNLDRDGLTVKSIKEDKPSSEFKLAIRTWALSRIPPDCLAHISLDEFVTRSLQTLTSQIKNYHFTQALFVWMLPILSNTLIELLHPYRPQVDLALRVYVREEIKQILNRLSGEFGIYGIEIDQIEARTLLFVSQTDKAVYASRCNQMREWVLEVLKVQIKQVVPFYCQPNMDMRDKWGMDPQTDTMERLKREKLLQKYLAIIG